MSNINIVLRTTEDRKLKNGAYPVCLQITWGKNTRYKTIKGFSCKPQSWDFELQRYKHSDRKNDLLDEYRKKARRISDYMEEWDYKRWVKELDRTEKNKVPNQKKLIAYARELESYYSKNNQVAYSKDFKSIASFLEKCFDKDIRIQEFKEKDLNVVLKKLDERGLRGYAYMKTLKITLSLAIQNGYFKAEDCPIKTKYSPLGYDINKRKGKESKCINKKRIKDMSEEEKEEVVRFYYEAEIPKMQKKHLAYWVLSYKLFGVNFIDLAKMKWEDVNNGYWKYNRSKTGIGSASGKPIPEDAMAILQEYDTGNKYILDILNDYEQNESRIQRRLHNYKANMLRSYKQISKRIFDNGRYITWYTGRYTSITLAIEKNIDLNTVRTLADHSSIKTTSKYVGLVRDRNKLKEAMDIL